VELTQIIQTSTYVQIAYNTATGQKKNNKTKKQQQHQKTNNMKNLQFIEELDFLLNETFYFTRQDGMIVSGSMSKDYDKAYSIYRNMVKGQPKSQEKVLFEVLIPSN
jgi:hypothetical protein